MDLQSKRLQLTEITEADIPALHQLNSFPEVAQFNTIGIPKELVETNTLFKDYLEDQKKPKRNMYAWVIRHLKDDSFVGEIGLRLSHPRYKSGEINYSLLPKLWGNGFAIEAAQATVKFAFETLNLHRLEAGVSIDNTPSIKLLEKLGMKREGQHREILPLPSGWCDNYSYAMLKSDYRRA